MNGAVESFTDRSIDQTGKRKFLVEYELPYVHIVRIGIKAKDEQAATSIAEQAFSDCTIWDNTPEMPLLYDDYEETGDAGDALVFRVVGEYQDWPEPEVCVKSIMRDAAAKRACEQIIAAYGYGESTAEREAFLQSALEEAHAALPCFIDSGACNSGESATLPTVVAWIEGGVVQWMASDRPMQYLVLDADVEGSDGVEITMENGDMAVVNPTGTLLVDHLPDWVSRLVNEIDAQ